jgi:hypothetical protein
VHGTIESTLEVEGRPLAELASIAAEWRALAARALVPNVFYEPAFALAAQPAFGRDVDVTLVWSRGATRRLLGLLPARIDRYRYGLPWPIVMGWINPYAPLGVPLVDREAASRARRLARSIASVGLGSAAADVSATGAPSRAHLMLRRAAGGASVALASLTRIARLLATRRYIGVHSA